MCCLEEGHLKDEKTVKPRPTVRVCDRSTEGKSLGSRNSKCQGPGAGAGLAPV